VGGNHITSDIAQVLRLPESQAEEIKLQHGHADQNTIDARQYFSVKPFGEQESVQVAHIELVQIISARIEEIFGMVMQEIKRSGYDGLLPAGMVLTGGSSALPGIRAVASRVLGLPVRVAQPENLIGMTDQLHTPAYSTSVGLLRWAMLMSAIGLPESTRRSSHRTTGGSFWDWNRIRSWLQRLLP
jgi:cell division protein FtsA